MSHQHTDVADPLAHEGPYQKKAYIWFIVVAVLASVMTFKFSQIDRNFYDSKGEYLDYDEYRANRTASASLASEKIDSRRERGIAELSHQNNHHTNEPSAHGAGGH